MDNLPRARQTRVRAYARMRKCKNNGGPYSFVKLEVRGRTWYSTNPRTPFPPISLKGGFQQKYFRLHALHHFHVYAMFITRDES